MRYLTVLARPGEGGVFHPLGKRLSAEPAITREAIHRVELLDEETVLSFAEGSGDRHRYEEIMDESPSVTDYLVSGDDRWMAVSQFEPTDSTRRMLERQRESDVVVETPIRVEDDGSLCVTCLGSESDLRDLFREVTDDPALSFEVVETGDYDPDEGSFARLLTTRQQEVLEAAVEEGYYNTPRESTHEDVANAVGIAPTTAGEHLRKIEERVFGALVR
ncbi:helix-turn-helix domain-containing protein [Halorussus sp. MSC15.2]|uniref:helix-turn-helix domain-containing protein n=1 Tax=Halorussus sp. MSC15.2 TaxID=2283638 RepID=UPI0013D7010D|nr:helix-turn-helix domain-containing protein [Halorussus sp. MSC15.2]NEU58805.1 helix-turn-helix domain-containing protein [Halorussus sp. MSC15.2]